MLIVEAKNIAIAIVKGWGDRYLMEEVEVEQCLKHYKVKPARYVIRCYCNDYLSGRFFDGLVASIKSTDIIYNL
jgi:hypothetical protein